MVAARAAMSFALVNFRHAPGMRLAELHQHLLRILQQGALKEAQGEYSLKPCMMTMFFRRP